MRDGTGRRVDYLRLSLTDRCDLRCVYCRPERGGPALDGLLSDDEILRLVRLLAELGVRHLRLTGGEPMVRPGCLELVRRLRDVPGIDSVSMTSNGQLLAGHVREAAGLSSLNLSLDALSPAVYVRLTRGGDVGPPLAALTEALDAGLPVKINVVPLRGQNEGELADLAALARDNPVRVRFIELMPIGCGRELEAVPTGEVIDRLTAAFGPLTPETAVYGHGPARYYRPAGFVGSIGFISPLSHAFCDSCNRIRLTADGRLKLCLNRTDGADLGKLLREGADDGDIKEAVRAALARKPAGHGFGQNPPRRETGNMNAIGG